MVKRFCDQCGVEMTANNTPGGGSTKQRLEASIGALRVEVLVAQNSTWNAGDYCKYCVLDALLQLDDRPRPTQ